jgi:hypothetical protein
VTTYDAIEFVLEAGKQGDKFWIYGFVDAISPISPTIINEMKQLYILFIQLRLPILEISSLNIQLLRREVIPATRPRPARPSETSHT